MSHLVSNGVAGIGVQPEVLSASAIERDVVRVVFSEGMTNNAAFTTPGNYVLTPAGGSAARIVIAVSALGGSNPMAVDLELDGFLTTGTNNYTVEVSNVVDAAGNPIDTSADTATFSGPAVGGGGGTPPEAELFPLDMYRFLIAPIIEADHTDGALFVKRFVAGPNEIWQRAVTDLQSIPKLWSVEDIADAHLQYLKNIVGWTSELSFITDPLDDATLRRLIAASGALWRDRGPEEAIVNVLRLVTGGTRMRIWNWFDFRWILGETELGEEHEGTDPWVIDAPSESRTPQFSDIIPSQSAEYFSNLRIVDSGSLDRRLVKDVLNLMRAANERFEIIYLSFLDLFESPGDNLQWNVSVVNFLVEDNAAFLSNSAALEWTDAIVTGSDTWTQYVLAARIRGESLTAGGSFGLLFYTQDYDNTYVVSINTNTQTLALIRRVGGTPTTIASVNLGTAEINILANVWYTIRVSIVVEGATNRIVVFVDGSELINTTNNQFSVGSLGFFHTTNATIECDDVEMFELPVDSETLEINS